MKRVCNTILARKLVQDILIYILNFVFKLLFAQIIIYYSNAYSKASFLIYCQFSYFGFVMECRLIC